MKKIRKTGKKGTNEILIHLAVWIAYIAFIYITNNVFSEQNSSVLSTFFYFIPFAITFYLSVYFLGLYKKMGVWWSVISFFLIFIVMAMIGYAYIYIILPKAGHILFSTLELKAFFREAIFGYVRIFSFALLYFYVREYIKKEKALRLSEKEKSVKELETLQYQYAFLRAQINPHFLHNTLNLFYSRAMSYSPDFADNILKLSSIMRYSMEALEFDSGKVFVQRELEQLNRLIEINNLRFGKTKQISFETGGEIRGHMVPPLSFITIVENAFKYGDLSDPASPLTIRINLQENSVHFYCCNKIKKNTLQVSSTKIGISNLEKRLDVAFKDKYKMEAQTQDNLYIFELTVYK